MSDGDAPYDEHLDLDLYDAMPDLQAIERELCRLPDVSVARLVTDDVGRIIEAHIIATPNKHPKQIVRDVQSVALAEFGLEIDESVEVRVWDSSAEVRYLVLPECPPDSEGLSEAELAALVTRDAMIGVAKVTASAPAAP